LFFQLKNKEVLLANISDQGCTLNSASLFDLDKRIAFCARSVKYVNFLTLRFSDLKDIMHKRKDLKKRIERYLKQQAPSKNQVQLDFSGRKFYRQNKDGSVTRKKPRPD